MAEGGEKPQHVADAVCSHTWLDDGHALVGESSLFKQVLNVADSVATNDCVVLIEGESGTGKELLARRIHMRSSRNVGPFIPVNCPGISESLFESQFFGHVRGAFTGADTDTLGAVRASEGGTLMLDEIGELPLRMQPKLLRLLQQREVTPVGSSRPRPVNTRFITATNQNLARRVAEGTFRADLYHRLNIVRIVIPPLRNRIEDMDPILDYYLDYFARRYNTITRRLGLMLRNQLREYPWPGNVRELTAYVERLYATNLPPSAPTMRVWDDQSRSTPKLIDPAPGRMGAVDNTPVCCNLAEAEATAIRNALEQTAQNRTAAAKLLGIHRTTLQRKMRSLGISSGRGRGIKRTRPDEL